MVATTNHKLQTHLPGNLIDRIPDQLTLLTALQFISIYDTGINLLPSNLANLSKLKRLQISEPKYEQKNILEVKKQLPKLLVVGQK